MNEYTQATSNDLGTLAEDARALMAATASGRPETSKSISLIIPACSPGLDS
jgi:hypothetical protein